MNKILKTYFSLFCLILFLFPAVEKQIHAFEHETETHCAATDKHFHELEHYCSICDFTITDSNAPIETNTQFILYFQKYSFQSFTESVNTPTSFSDLPSRAPPIV